MQTPGNSEAGPNRAARTDAGPVGALRGNPPADQQLKTVVDRVAGGVVVLHVAGEIDLLTANVLGERIREQFVPGNRVLVLNLTDVTFLGSAGLAEVVSASQSSAERELQLMLVATSRAVLRPLEATGLLSLLTIYGTVDEAVVNAQP